MTRLLILADDLTGAADCAASASLGRDTVLALGDLRGDTRPEVLAVDADTRSLTPQLAADKVAQLVRRYAVEDEVLLFKKIDSTLRGHLGAELAAALEAHRATHSHAGHTVAVMAPAFPAAGRTTVNGLQRLHGQPLHEHDIWRLHEITGSSYIPEMLEDAGLQCILLQLETVRAAGHALEDAMRTCSSETDVLVCDAETDEDLQAIAAASTRLGRRVIWVGSAGLARHLAHAARPDVASTAAQRTLPKPSGPLLFVIGSQSRRSIEQVRVLASSSEVVQLSIPPEVLLAGAESTHWHVYQGRLLHAMERDLDVVIGPGSDVQLSMAERSNLAAALARMTAQVSDRVGGLIASGGETARRVLDHWAVTELHLLGELEKGVPVSVTANWSRPLSIITKAGDFGEPETLLRCRQFLNSANPSLSYTGEKTVR